MVDTKQTTAEAVNEVRLAGRVSAAPEEREMPSGDRMLSFRLVVDRSALSQAVSKQRVDVLDCAVWGGRPRRTVSGWRPGDVVEVTGEIRRRFYRSGGRTGSRVEVEVRTARLIRRAATA